MALIKMKPTSPGTRFVVKVDRSHLHKGGPLASLTTKKPRTGASSGCHVRGEAGYETSGSGLCNDAATRRGCQIADWRNGKERN